MSGGHHHWAEPKRVAPVANGSVKTVFKTILQMGALDERRKVRASARLPRMITAALSIAFTGLGSTLHIDTKCASKRTTYGLIPLSLSSDGE